MQVVFYCCIDYNHAQCFYLEDRLYLANGTLFSIKKLEIHISAN